ncbi:MAG: hypothetical protein R3F31_20665 [Verrucomicrobiales bacterium]
MDPSTLTISQLRAAYGGRFSDTAVVRSLLAAAEARDGELGGYLSLDGETALAAAEAADLLPLGGVAHRDRTTSTSRDSPAGVPRRS